MKACVLILDGDRWHRETLAAALAYEGCHAEHTGDAASAMALLARHRFHLVLLDPSAPATGGWKTVERLLLLKPDLPLIVFASDEGHPRSIPLTRANGIIPKPINFFTLLSAIGHALSTPANAPVSHGSERVPPDPALLPGRVRLPRPVDLPPSSRTH